MTTGKFRPGDLLGGRYRLERLLGGGGMGVVFSAVDIESQKRVAVKVVRCDGTPTPAQQKRLVLEARAALLVQHPNIVRVFDVVATEEGAPVIVMELLRGLSLSALLAGGVRMSPRRLARILEPVVSAVIAAHERGIVHRDLKPDNIFRIYEGEVRDVRVLDFGIAKLAERAMGEETAVVTADGFALGTLEYMAPEQLLPKGSPDHRVDIWSLGVIAYECLSGMRPVRANDPVELVATLRRGVPSLSAVAPHVPSDLAALVNRMLAVDADRRPSLHEVRATILAHRNTPMTPERQIARLAPPRSRALRLVAAIAIPATVFLAGFALGRCSADAGEVESNATPHSAPYNGARRLAALAATTVD